MGPRHGRPRRPGRRRPGLGPGPRRRGDDRAALAHGAARLRPGRALRRDLATKATSGTIHRSIVADDSRLAANRLDGLRISSGATQVTASKNLIDVNHRAGVFVADGTAEIGPANRLLDNEMGVWLPADARGTAVMDNSIEGNTLDGVHLDGLRVGHVRGNLIRANRKAAFPVAFKGSAKPFLSENRVMGNPAKERVRAEGRPRPTG
jgi:Right handed beta helix region